jgi:hypothetical protein
VGVPPRGSFSLGLRLGMALLGAMTGSIMLLIGLALMGKLSLIIGE